MTHEIEKKYNTLYNEVAKYYHLDHKVRTISDVLRLNPDSFFLNFINIDDFGYNNNNKSTTTSNIVVHLAEYFPYLVPFYKFFHRECFCKPGNPDSHISLLKDINKVMKKLRKEKFNH